MHQALATGRGAAASGGVSGAKSADGGVVTLAQNDTSKAVVFAAAFTAAPAVTGQVLLPNNTSSGIAAWPDESTRTSGGVTFLFSDAIPASTYKLAWQAVGS
jgi:hypothetical protein